MSRVVLLDSGPLGMVTNPRATPISLECQLWFDSLESRGYEAMLPEIADYEVRRELLRVGKVASIRRLDQLKAAITYRPITTAVMLKAAELWAEARKRGRPTADPKALDGDVILAAQAIWRMASSAFLGKSCISCHAFKLGISSEQDAKPAAWLRLTHYKDFVIIDIKV